MIGADGLNSTVRKLVYAEETDLPRPNKCAILASIVPSAGWAHVPEWEKYRDHNGVRRPNLSRLCATQG